MGGLLLDVGLPDIVPTVVCVSPWTGSVVWQIVHLYTLVDVIATLINSISFAFLLILVSI